MMSDPRISIVILGYNRKDDIREVLNQLCHQSFTNFETIVVDNNSTDSSPNMIEKEFKKVQLLRLSQNRGIASYNEGFSRAKGEIIVVLNNDSYPAFDALEKIVNAFSHDESLGIIQGKIININTNEIFYPAGKEADSQETMEWHDFVVAGSGIRKKVLEKVGYFPKSVFLFGAEHDLSLRAIAAGYSIKYFPQIKFYHIYRPAYLPSIIDTTFYHFRSYYWLIWRRYPILKAMNSTIGLSLILFSRSFKERKIIVHLKAIFAALWNLPLIINERKPLKNKYIKKYEKKVGSNDLIDIIKRKLI